MATSLHHERLDTVVSTLLASGANSVLDLGCGPGELLLRLRLHPQFVRLLGIDIDERALADARLALGLDWLRPEPRLAVRLGSFAEVDRELTGFDAAVLLETIEHIEPGHLPRVERAVFASMHPGLVLVTTPNQEYNLLHGMQAGRKRHPGHHFEWSRAQFQHWAAGVALRHGYSVSYTDLGPPDPVRGSSSQMARFVALEAL
ncbi:MAG: class I SAM-dependent methyltransferase [Gammaproteobacteria bacterium]|uniref:methyltransferase domain-containing protein n=1 Tax=Rhodoferax sp. TaxID=50421 RepID=UPI0017D22903|nr:methyltransferase domain-containing protein [Rhodoferax sp.]MBU3898542.1 class I SAM-dependent methyltransferase [Gammaproteobacteria bacterium]MBA3056842.1 methyltransferase domain-containing protein [Rhodoferax sp.]MBU3997869.1 class I SAM-dependent methyltransferase [Gammaproteobacteria bacterium]MBU4079317.1 class I SAM-dependent methyltransferase [Gammaproteobacteria bacterium]MBU4113221.1 class I SAM-dependent methyltransferase [Gammaproteobacteria bacterium]